MGNRKKVCGFGLTAVLGSRIGRIKPAANPINSRSHGARFGARFCERLRTISWCFKIIDSARTLRTPPGRIIVVKVADE